MHYLFLAHRSCYTNKWIARERPKALAEAGNLTASKSNSVFALASKRRERISLNGFRFGQQMKMRDCRVGMGVRICIGKFMRSSQLLKPSERECPASNALKRQSQIDLNDFRFWQRTKMREFHGWHGNQNLHGKLLRSSQFLTSSR